MQILTRPAVIVALVLIMGALLRQDAAELVLPGAHLRDHVVIGETGPDRADTKPPHEVIQSGIRIVDFP